jgi:serine phosphatase RsbU (regulator of sigma subunit)
VSGKGVPAALFMAVSRTLLRAVAQTAASPGECLARLNDLLSADNEQMMFVTVFYAVIDVRDGSLVMANAGHDPPLLLRSGDGSVEPLDKTPGMALAVFEGNVYEESRLQLAPGERLFLFTDGVTEAFDPHQTLYGTERLIALLGSLRGHSVDEIPGEVIEAVKRFEAGGPQSDDITCMAIAWRGAR